MKQGTTQAIALSLNIDLTTVDTIIFTVKSKPNSSMDILIQKTYPQDTFATDGKIFLLLTQAETIDLPRFIYIEGQVNFINKSVGKTETVKKFVEPTLLTTIIDGNISDISDNETVSLNLNGDVLMMAEIAKLRFEKFFKPQNFTQSLSHFTVIVPQSEHCLGFKFYVKECLRKQGEDFCNIIYQYKILPNGDLVIHSHEQFSGRLLLEEM